MRNNLFILLLMFICSGLFPSEAYGSTTRWGDTPLPGKYYLLARQKDDSRKVLTPRNFRYANNSVLIFMPNNPQVGLSAWKFVAVDGKPLTYQLLNDEYDMAVDLSMGNGNKEWSDVLLWNADAANPNQQLTFVPSRQKGAYKIKGISQNGTVFYVVSRDTIRIGGSPETTFERVPDEAAATDFVLREVTAKELSQAAAESVSCNDWENQLVIGRNKETGHATYIPYPTVESMRADKAYYDTPWLTPKSPYYQSLNGVWNLKWKEQKDITLYGASEFWGDNVST